MIAEIVGGLVAAAGCITVGILIPDGDPTLRTLAERIVDDRSWRDDMRRQIQRHGVATAGWRQVTGGELVVTSDDWVLLGECAVIARGVDIPLTSRTDVAPPAAPAWTWHEPDDMTATLVGHVDDSGQLRIVEVRSAAIAERQEQALIRRVHAGLFRPVHIGRPPARLVREYVTASRRALAVAA